MIATSSTSHAQPGRRPRLLLIVTDALTTRFLTGQVAHLRSAGFDVIVVASPGPRLVALGATEGVSTIAVDMAREIQPLRDLRSLGRLVRVVGRLKPDIVHAGTPKAGLLGMIAARLAGIPVRIYQLRGLRLEGVEGPRRAILAATERISAVLATRVLCNSASLRTEYLALGLARPQRTRVLASGSSNGVDADRFVPTPQRGARAAVLRHGLRIPPDSTVVGFVGRLTEDKGIADLIAAWSFATAGREDTHLLLVGGFESGDALSADAVATIADHPRIHVTGFVEEPADHYHAMDLVVLPSYREGFPNVPLEAASARLPVVAYRATGTVDAVVDEVTGTLVDVGDVPALAQAIGDYLDDPPRRRRHGLAGERRAREEFAPETVWTALAEEYRQLLGTPQ